MILAGYVHRMDSQFLANLSRSSSYLNAISNRLAAPSTRASILGMYVGTAVSELVDPPNKRMNFSSEEMKSADGRRYLHLISVQDSVGSMEDLKLDQAVKNVFSTEEGKNLDIHEVNAIKSTAPRPTPSKIISIEEVDDEPESEDEDLPMYEKPDSDPSDSDEDPTLIDRSKPAAPV